MTFAYLIEPPALPESATAGDALRFNWLWRKLRASKADSSTQLLWLDERGDVAAASAPLPLVQGYDFADWRLGEVNRGHHRSIVPASLPAGHYTLGIRPLDAAGLPTDDVIALEQTMMVTLPQREFEAPRIDSQIRRRVGQRDCASWLRHRDKWRSEFGLGHESTIG